MSTRSVAVEPSGSRAGEPEADDLRHEHRDGLPQHGRLGLDAADAPAEHAEAVDHRRVRVGAEQRVRERLPVPRLDDAREELEVDLVDDAGRRRDDRQPVERLLAEAEERVALAVALELELGVARHRAARRERVHLHGVVDDEVRRQLRVDAHGIAAEVAHRVAHRDEVDDRRHAGEVLVEDARGREAQLARRLVGRHPAGDGLHVGLRAGAQRVLEQDPQRERQPLDVVRRLKRVQAEDLVVGAADLQ